MKYPQWRAFTVDLHSSKVYKNPFLDVTAHLMGPNGETLELLGFWDGGDLWRIRIALTACGSWKCVIRSSDPENSGLTAEMEFLCVPYEGTLDIYKHGFLRVGPQGRYLMYDDGTPFFWLGDTHWTFVTEERFDESNCPKYESQFRACVDQRVQQKFTVYQSNFRDGKSIHSFGNYIDYLVETENGLLLA